MESDDEGSFWSVDDLYGISAIPEWIDAEENIQKRKVKY